MISLLTGILMAGVAAPPIGSRIPRDEWANARDEKASEVRKISQKFGECVVQKYPDAAREMVLNKLNLKDDDRQDRALIRKVADGNCLLAASQSFNDVRMSLPGDNMRYALAEALIHRELTPLPTLSDLAQVPPLSHPVLDETEFEPKNGKPAKGNEAVRLAENRGKEEARIVLSRFGECVVRTNPDAARTLLQTQVVTPGENAAFASLNGALASCVKAGETIKLDKAIVRGTVAYNYYRLARAARSMPVASASGAK